MVPGQDKIELGQEEKTKLGLAMDGFFDGIDAKGSDGKSIARFRSLHEAYKKITGLHDSPAEDIMRESFVYLPKFASKLTSIMESLQTSSWGQILGDSITRKMIKEYNVPDLNIWRKLVTDIVPIKDFRTNRRMLLGGYGELPAVSETGTYQALSSPGDDEATYAISKKGGTEDITMEMIANDDVGAIRRIPKALGRAAALTIYRTIFDLFKNNTATCYDGKVIFHADHANLGSAALSDSAMTDIKVAMMAQTAYGNALEVLGMANLPKWLLVPSKLEGKANKLCISKTLIDATGNAATEPNLHSQYGLDYIVVPYWTSDVDFVAVADPQNIPTIEVGFFNGKEEPELFVQDMPNVGSVFTADKITYKIRYIFGVCPLDYRGMQKNVVVDN
jgi:hypothetical protein